MFERLSFNHADYPTIVPVNKAIHESARSLTLFRVLPTAMGRYAKVEQRHCFIRSGASHQARHSASGQPCSASGMPSPDGTIGSAGAARPGPVAIDTKGYDGVIVRMPDFSRCRPQVIEHKNLGTAERRLLQARQPHHRTLMCS
jgi:hypothetical protein